MVFFCSGFFSRLGYYIWIVVIANTVYLCCLLDFDEPAITVLTPATHIGLGFSTMASEKKCCVPNCGSDNEILHKFPNPAKDPVRFRTWLYNIGGDILSLDNLSIFHRRRVCHRHFEISYHTRSKMLTANAIPRLCLPGILTARTPLKDVTNKTIPCSSTSGQLPLDEPPPGPSNKGSQIEQNQHSIELKSKQLPSRKSKMAQVMDKNEQLLANEIKKLKRNNDSYKNRLSKALKLSTNTAFQTAIKKFKTLAALFTIMQFREINKPKMGRRFTKEEKIMALSVYKQGPKAYRWLKNIFILPSPVTISRMISRAALKPGINENIFEQLRKKGQKMKAEDKLCTLIFDEMSLTPHFDYNQKKDKISGFVNHTGQSMKKIANHVLVYMIRGVTRNYKQPIYYSFCSGSTPKEVLAIQIKEIIKKLHSIGFTVLATICDQGTSNTSAISYLVEETRADYLRRNEEMHNYVFEVERDKIIPLFDVPHLLKGIRNNLLTKNLKYRINGEEKTAKWEHITQLYENNPSYKGLKIIKNLTENHCNKDKIPKMKVKYASQLFSQTVGKTMGYLADNGLLPEETKDTADFIIFIDNLFDSLNGSMKNSRVRSGKDLLRNITPTSNHNEIWRQAKNVIKSMKFVTVGKGTVGTVPSINNWLKTIENMEILRETLFHDYNIKSFWCRHFNQDPLENFFGSIRSHGVRNTSPTCVAFEAAFASLLVNNMNSNYCPGSNCEDDFCSNLQSFRKLFFSKNTVCHVTSEIDFSDLNEDIMIDFENKAKDPIIIAQLEYVSGYTLRKAKTIFKNCSVCKQCLFTNDLSKNKYIQQREYLTNKKYLTYPHENFTKCFSEIQDILHHILKNKSHKDNLKGYMKTILYVQVNTNFIKCCNHKTELIEFIFDFCSRFYCNNWCRSTNKLLNGTSKNVDTNDEIQNMAIIYSKKRHSKK